MSYGISATGDDGKLSFHSDYSSVVYAGVINKIGSPAQPVYQGTHHVAISAAQKGTNYGMGWLVQYQISLDVDYMLPFYCPTYNGQSISILDIINEGNEWLVNVLYSGVEANWPQLYAFAPLSELPSSIVNESSYGISVYDSSSDLVFTDSKPPLRIDAVIQILHDSTIRTGARGVCANPNTNSTCHVDLRSDTVRNYTGTHLNTATSLYHIVPSAYGGLAYVNSFSGSINCGWFGSLSRPVAWKYQSWSSHRGSLSHNRGGYYHEARYLSDFAGAAHQYVQGSCGFGGFLGALIGLLLAFVTLGAGLILIGGALAGFVIAGFTTTTAPALKAYEFDENHDTANPTNLLCTDKSYYGIS